MMGNRLLITMLLVTGLGMLNAQNGGNTAEQLLVFLDCESCDDNFVKQELAYVNYTVDPIRAKVQVLVNNQWLGGGGRLMRFQFIGRGPFEGDQFSIDFLVDPQNTNLERNEGIVATLKQGLVPFMVKNGEASRLQINVANAPDQDESAESKADAPGFLDQWIYEVYSRFDFNTESNRRTLDFRYGLNLNYITDEWRVRIRPRFFYQERFVRNDEQDITFVRRDNEISTAVINSLGDHWAVGFFYNWNQSTFRNIKLGQFISPAIEYSIFPYSEAITKEFTVSYRIGLLNNQYLQETVFLKTAEQFTQQSLAVRLNLRERWGNVNIEIEGANFLEDFKKNRINLEADISVRVIKGLSFSIGGNYEVVNNQISLPRGDATLEEILLGQRQLATSFEASLNFGVTYTFGALYNNTVNTRL